MNDRRFVAAHESNHAAVAYRVGHTISIVSIAPSRRWNGMCFHDSGELDAEVWDRVRPPETPLVMQPVEFRAYVELRILISLAGPIGEEFARMNDRVDGYGFSDDDRVAVKQAVREIILTEHQRELLASRDEGESLNDHQKTRALAELLVAEEEIYSYIAWLETSARRIVRDPDTQRLVEALVQFLLEHETVPGDEVERLFDEVQARADVGTLIRRPSSNAASRLM